MGRWFELGGGGGGGATAMTHTKTRLSILLLQTCFPNFQLKGGIFENYFFG